MVNQKPKHKPSPKRTLEEVLHSLQDLIRNELIEKPQPGTAGPSAPAPEPAEDEPEPADAGYSSESDIQSALHSLEGLITHELDDRSVSVSMALESDHSPSDTTIPDTVSIDDVPEPDIEPPDTEIPPSEEQTPTALDSFSDEEALPEEPISQEVTPTTPPDKASETKFMSSESPTTSADRSTGSIPPEGLQETFAFDLPLPTIEVEETDLDGLEITDEQNTVSPIGAQPTELLIEDRPQSTTPGDSGMEGYVVEFEKPDSTAMQKEEVTAESDDESETESNAPVQSSDLTNSAPTDSPERSEQSAVLDKTGVGSDSGIIFDMIPEDVDSIPSVEFDAQEIYPPTEDTGVSDEVIEFPSDVSSPNADQDTPEQHADQGTATELEMPPSLDMTETEGDEETDLASAAPPEIRPEDETTTEPAVAETSERLGEPAESDVTPSKPRAEAPTEQLSEKKIPVLEEVVPHPTGEYPAPPLLLALPKRTRDIAVQTIAKLNIELRRCGERTLTPQLVDRLQYLLRETLEQAASDTDTPAKQSSENRKNQKKKT